MRSLGVRRSFNLDLNLRKKEEHGGRGVTLADEEERVVLYDRDTRAVVGVGGPLLYS